MINCLKNFNVEVKANIYFAGNVTSRKIISSDGKAMTLGIILPGEYEFPVEEKEIVEITSGYAEVLLPDEKEWKGVEKGKSFTVIANSTYKIKSENIVEYLCSYVKE
jgi:hypothetical protein